MPGAMLDTVQENLTTIPCKGHDHHFTDGEANAQTG